MNEIDKISVKSYLGAKVKKIGTEEFTLIIAVKPFNGSYIFSLVNGLAVYWVTKETLEKDYEFI